MKSSRLGDAKTLKPLSCHEQVVDLEEILFGTLIFECAHNHVDYMHFFPYKVF